MEFRSASLRPFGPQGLRNKERGDKEDGDGDRTGYRWEHEITIPKDNSV